MKTSVNTSMEMIDLAISEISRIILAQSNGDLSIRIKHNFNGELNVLTQAIEQATVTMNDMSRQVAAK